MYTVHVTLLILLPEVHNKRKREGVLITHALTVHATLLVLLPHILILVLGNIGVYYRILLDLQSPNS